LTEKNIRHISTDNFDAIIDCQVELIALLRRFTSLKLITIDVGLYSLYKEKEFWPGSENSDSDSSGSEALLPTRLGRILEGLKMQLRRARDWHFPDYELPSIRMV
jgi:hypothetical protein